ncbi:hypothetical protein BJV77DRAFT_1071745 [Russula vinacea]|nr:hypothetical protein BJV77DRAFT_1071745 [Russula vinacea]
MLAGSSHARVRVRWIIARPFLLDARARWISTHARPCPLDPRTPVPAGSPRTPVCARWIPARPCLLDPRTPVPAGSPRTPVCLPTGSPRLPACVPTGSPRLPAHARPPDVHARPSPRSLVRSRRPLARGAPMHSRGVPTLAHAASLSVM